MTATVFEITRNLLFVQQLVQANNTENIKSPYNWSFVRGIYWSPSQRASNAEKGSMSWFHHVEAFENISEE